MKNNQVLIIAIRAVKNGAHQLQLSQEVERASSGGLVSLLMQGHAGFTKPKPRVAFVTVSQQQMEHFKFAVGTDFSETLGKEVNLQVTEGFKPFGKSKDKQGNLVDQFPKINPANGSVLTKGGLPIYRKCEAVLGQANDNLIQHDVVIVAQPILAAKPANVMAN